MSRSTVQIALLSAVFVGCARGSDKEGDTAIPLLDPDIDVFVHALGDRPELPEDPTNAWADDETAAWFGRFLYFDTRLSSTGEVACASCHAPVEGFGDGLPLSEGVGTTGRHAPNIWNAAYQRWMFWDGRCDTLWCQATGPIESPGEMDFTRMELARLIFTDPDLSDAYTEVFGAPPDVSDRDRFPMTARPGPSDPEDPDRIAWSAMTETDQHDVTAVLVNVGKAIAAYERTVLTGDTSVDRFVTAFIAGDRATAESALSAEAIRGLELFAGEGECVFCHSGWLTSNKEFHNIGLPEVATVDPFDTGRYDGINALRDGEFNAASMWSDDPTGAIASRLGQIALTTEQLGQFRTPALRRVAHNGPYMHGGHFDTLDEVVAFYNDPGDYEGPGHREELLEQRGWSDDDQAALVAFLTALSDDPAPSSALTTAPATPLP